MDDAYVIGLLYGPQLLSILLVVVLMLYGSGGTHSRNRAMLGPLVIMFFWLSCQMIAQITSSSLFDLEFIRLSVALSWLMAVAFYYAMRGYAGLGKRSWKDAFVWGAATAVAIVGMTNLSIRAVSSDAAGISLDDVGIFYTVQIVLTLILFLLGVRILYRYTKSRPRVERSRHYVLLIAITQMIVLSGIGTLFFAHVAGAQAFIFVGTLLFCAGVFFGIIRHQLFDVRLVAVRTATYLLSILSLAAIYMVIAYVVSIVLLRQDITVGLSVSPINIILALVLAFVFQPIKRFFDHWTNRIFYRDQYNTDEFIGRLSRALTSTTQLHEVLKRALQEVSTTLKADGGLFIVYRDNYDDVLVGHKSYDDYDEEDYERVRQIAHVCGDGVLVVDPTENHHDESQKYIHRLLAHHKVALVLPLVTVDQTIGYLLLGEQMGSSYAKRDISVLEMVADELVIAIQNARSVQAVRDLNIHLEQRINSATKELRASNKRLVELDAMKDEFVSMASHQLRTPLTSVKGYISMVLEGDAGKISKAQQQLLQEAFTSSERMVHLISDFLNVSRLQTGKFVVDRRESDLAVVTSQEVANIGQIAVSHQVKVSYKKPARFPVLYIDEGKIRQVIMNFIDNAIYYSPDSASVKVTLTVEDGDAVLRVIDKGMGVPEEAKDKLFTKFFRAENARKQRPDGTGVGLFLAKKVIDGHGGSLVFESVVGKGSTFGFRLPIKKLSSPPPPDEDDITP